MLAKKVIQLEIKYCMLSTCIALFLFCTLSVCNADTFSWQPITEKNMRVIRGSALDFSTLNPPKEDISEHLKVVHDVKGAHFFYKNKQRRLFCAVMTFQNVFGGFPSHQDSDEYADELSIRGYNLVRFMSLQDVLMQGYRKNFDYDAERLDRLQYFMAALKKRGIFWEVDVLSWDVGGPAANERYLKGTSRMFRSHLFYDSKAMLAWKGIVDHLFLRKNPYTGTSLLADPALAIITPVNENDLLQSINIAMRVNSWLDKTVKYQLNIAFSHWLKQHAPIKFSRLSKGDRSLFNSHTSILAEIVGFSIERSQRTHHTMTSYLREKGYRGLITGMNNDGNQIGSSIPRQGLDVITMHAYHDHPTELGTVNQTFGPTRRHTMLSSTDGSMDYLRRLFMARQANKPFVVDEYNHAFPNPWRREAALVIPAYGSLHDWDGICRFSRPVELAYGHTEASRHHYATAFGVGMDPIARAGETLAGLLFLRQDVHPTDKVLRLQMNQDDFIDSGIAWQRWPLSINGLGLLTKTEVLWVKQGKHQKGFVPLYPHDFKKNHAELLPTFLKVLHVDKHFSISEGYVSSNKEVRTKNKQIIVSTSNTEAASFDGSTPIHINHLNIQQSNSAGLLSISSIDQQPLATSKRMLLIYLTDARNSDMVIKGKTLTKHGHLPILIRSGSVKFSFQRANSAGCLMDMYALTLQGKRVEKMKTHVERNKQHCMLNATVDTKKLHQPSLYFELIARE